MAQTNKIDKEEYDPDAYLICKTCKAELPVRSMECSQCGDEDPFYFKEIRMRVKWTAQFAQFMVGAIMLASGFIWFLTKWWIALISFHVLILLYVFFYMQITIKYFINRHLELIEFAMNEIQDEHSFEHWSEQVNDIKANYKEWIDVEPLK